MKKKRKNKNNLTTIVIFTCMCFAFTVFGPIACSSVSNRTEVRIELDDPGVIDFEKYDTIFYKDLALESMPKDYSPEEELKVFFLDELGKVIEKKIEHWTADNETEKPDNALLITGTLKLDIKERSKIKEVKKEDNSGKKKAFVTVQHWDLTLTVILKDITTGKNLFKENFNAKLGDAEVGPDSSKFNFEGLFYKVTNRLVNKLTRTKKMQRRYLLL